MLDIPILRDVDDDAGIYLAGHGSTTPWPGCVIYYSTDASTWTEFDSISASATFGTTTDALGDWTGTNVFDQRNTVTVNVGYGTLASSTRAAMFADGTINLALIGNEIIRYTTATLQAVGIYKLSGLIRGLRGTDWARTGHSFGDRFCVLTTATVARKTMANALIGVGRYYKAVTVGKSVDDVAYYVAFTNQGRGLKPFSPRYGRATRNPLSGDVTLSWKRRTRLSTRLVGSLGISVPLGESSEAYEVAVMSGSTEVRTLSATTNAATYTAAQQTADFGSPTPSSFTFDVYQLSSAIGRGYAHRITL